MTAGYRANRMTFPGHADVGVGVGQRLSHARDQTIDPRNVLELVILDPNADRIVSADAFSRPDAVPPTKIIASSTAALRITDLLGGWSADRRVGG